MPSLLPGAATKAGVTNWRRRPSGCQRTQVCVGEIQIFEIALKTRELREDVLRTIDRAIPPLVFFELTFEGRVKFVASYKRASEVADNQPVVETYFETPWQDATVPRLPLPVALDMA
jgi:hypothetical protein